MRFLILCLLSFTCTTLYSQKPVPLGKGWQVSFELSVDPDTKRLYTPFVTAADTLSFDRLFPRSVTEVNLDGTSITYYSEPALERNGKLESILLNILPAVKLHYRTSKNFEFGLGFFFRTQKESQRVKFDPNLPDNYLIRTSEFNTWFAGIRTDAVYNLLPAKRLQPYVGLQLDFGVEQANSLNSFTHFPGLGIVQERESLLNERFQKNTLLNFDGRLLLGVNYRLSDKLALGFVTHLSRYLLPQPAGIQLRYLFGPKPTE